ncbi:protein cortex-like isoform X2 [Aricia agestis]|uniref:protein cortex-like isoform X2 n=1 Tax=Aricia agestis TaxID=91739 RepID=UPI001C203FB6|nr:protein cortex-like isoform X2 [Aricia agestis]
MERKTFGKKTHNQRPRVDRFVPTRDRVHNLQRRRSWHAACSQQTDVDIWYAKYIQQKKYANYLDDAFGIEPATKDPDVVQTWPCRPRKRSYLSSADSILDLPSYSYAVFPELLDWSSDNILVAALGLNYHKWSWRTQSLTSQGLTRFPIQCCKFHPRGELLALGTEAQVLEIHHNGRNKALWYCFCKCATLDDDFCNVVALDWSPTGNSLASGCTWGTVSSFSRNGEVISWQRLARKAVLAVRVSPDARYVAATSLNSAYVTLLTWPALQLYSVINADWTIRTITWHPWRSALLGIGTMTSGMQARLVLWDAPSSRVRETTLGRHQYSLDAMLFSRRSGELVISLWNTERPQTLSKTYSQLVVLSGPETVVDQWGEGRYGLDRVRTMVFSPDGTKLATATADEDLIIWNFLPEDKVKKKTKCRRFSALPVYIDEANQGFSLR